MHNFSIRFLSKWPTCAAFIVIVWFAAAVWCHNIGAYADPVNSRQSVTLGFEQPGTSVYAAPGIDGTSAGRSPFTLQVGTRESYVLRSLGQFTNLLDIESDRQALRFVRLRTTQQYVYHWGLPHYMEIVTHRQLADPAFHDVVLYDAGAKIPVELTRDATAHDSGHLGELSTIAYRQGHFAPPVVVRKAEGWSITRWILVENGIVTVEKWRETVGSDGSYNRKVLLSEPAPKLTGTRWSGPPTMNQ